MVKFLVDFMLGKLARELRILGFDALYVEKKDLTANPLTILYQAKQGLRIFLTRNTKLKDYSEAVFIINETVKEQVGQVIKHFKLQDEIKPFTRCLRCNEVLTQVAKENIKGKVPFYIFQTKDKFVYCQKCRKIYWAGTHLKDMEKRVKEHYLTGSIV